LLGDTVEKMVDVNEDSRPDFRQLKSSMPPYAEV